MEAATWTPEFLAHYGRSSNISALGGFYRFDGLETNPSGQTGSRETQKHVLGTDSTFFSSLPFFGLSFLISSLREGLWRIQETHPMLGRDQAYRNSWIYASWWRIQEMVISTLFFIVREAHSLGPPRVKGCKYSNKWVNRNAVRNRISNTITMVTAHQKEKNLNLKAALIWLR